MRCVIPSEMLILAFLLAAFPAWAGKTHVIVCVDCFSSAGFYKAEAEKQLPPGDKIEWHYVKTHDYSPGFQASAAPFKDVPWIQDLDPRKPADWEKLVSRIKALKPDLILGGMDEGTYYAGLLKLELGMPGNTREALEIGHNKHLQAQRAPGLTIPTHVLTNLTEAMAFIDRLQQSRVVVKFSVGGGGTGYEEFEKTQRKKLSDFLQSRLENRNGNYGFEVKTIIQPYINGPQYYVQTDTDPSDGLGTVVVGLWSYHKIRHGRFPLPFLDRPVSLFSPLAKKFHQAVNKTNTLMDFREGSTHQEYIHDLETDKLYLVENNERDVGAGITRLEEKIWGASQTNFQLLRYFNRGKYLELRRSFPRRMLQDGMVVILPSTGEGQFREDAVGFIRGLKTFTPSADYYVPSPTRKVVPTENLNSSAATLHFSNPITSELRGELRSLIDRFQADQLLAYKNELCLAALDRQALVDQLWKAEQEASWEFTP
ncbi:hypothetical protein K2X33_15840 [bacterium]|nr:hypothetical protein [bacterium]